MNFRVLSQVKKWYDFVNKIMKRKKIKIIILKIHILNKVDLRIGDGKLKGR